MKMKILNLLAVGMLFSPLAAHAAPISIGKGDFSGSETVVTYTGEPNNVLVDGRTIGGVLHNSTGTVETDAITATQNLSSRVVFAARGSDTLSLLFPALQTRVGFDFVTAPGSASVANAVTVELFDALDVSLGSLSFDSAVPGGFSFPEGFAGLESTTGFLRAQVVFYQGARQWALDNLRYEGVAQVPEPGTLALLGLSLAGLGLSRRRRAA